MTLEQIGFFDDVTAFGFVWKRILPHHKDDVECELNLRTRIVTITIKAVTSPYKGREIFVPLSNVTYYELAKPPKKISRK